MQASFIMHIRFFLCYTHQCQHGSHLITKLCPDTVPYFSELDSDEFGDNRPEIQRKKKDFSFTDIGPLKNNERRDLNCAVKEYLLLAGYRLTAMTFYEEVF